MSTRAVNRSGFTLIEVLLVIAILAILAAVVIVAINPAKQLSTARDAERHSDVYAILGAVYQYALDHEGQMPEGLTADEREICKGGSTSCSGMYDLSVLIEESRYLVEIPEDPLCAVSDANCSENGTGYYMYKSPAGRITVSAYGSENGDISVTR